MFAWAKGMFDWQPVGVLTVRVGEQVKAVESFEAARAACRRSLEIAPNDERIQRYACVARLPDGIQALIEQAAGDP